jgi:hypothetical protein
MAKHTEGNWYVYNGWAWRTCIVVDGDDSKPYALAECFSMDAAGEKEANAALICAAPEMLALLRRYASECQVCRGSGLSWIWDGEGRIPDTDKPCKACADVRETIAKATGEA